MSSLHQKLVFQVHKLLNTKKYQAFMKWRLPMTNNNDRDELRRIYKCIWFDFSDDVNREDMWIKEFENYAAKQVAKAERATKQKELDRLEMEVSMCDNPSKFSPVKYLEIRRAELQQDGE